MPAEPAAEALGGRLFSHRPVGTVNALAIGLTALGAGLVTNVALVLERGRLPRTEVALIVFYSISLACCAVAVYLLLVRARALNDGRMRWLAAGLCVTAVALFIQLLGFASFLPQEAGLRYGASGSALITLLWHALLVLCVVGAVTRPRARPAAIAAIAGVGLGLVVITAAGGSFVPRLITSGGRYTSLYRTVLEMLAVASLGATLMWAGQTGRRTSWVEASITMALAFATWDVAMASFAEARFTPVWWTSMIMRLLQFLVLGGGLLSGFTSLYHALERHQASMARHLEELRHVREDRAARDGEGAELAHVLDRVRGAIDTGVIRMVFQPIVDLHSGSYLAVEALARFDAEPQRPPDVWFREAAMVGLAEELELEAIVAALSRTGDLPPGVAMAINVSPQTALSPRFTRCLESVAARSDQVVIELTEHARIDDYEALNAALGPPRRQGVRLAVDDAGAGFASLRHIVRLAPDVIKLDISLTRDIDMDPVRRALAASLIRFADEIEAEIIAEGVESEDEVLALRELGVRYGQGYYFARPGPLLVPADADGTRSLRSARVGGMASESVARLAVPSQWGVE